MSVFLDADIHVVAYSIRTKNFDGPDLTLSSANRQRNDHKICEVDIIRSFPFTL